MRLGKRRGHPFLPVGVPVYHLTGLDPNAAVALLADLPGEPSSPHVDTLLPQRAGLTAQSFATRRATIHTAASASTAKTMFLVRTVTGDAESKAAVWMIACTYRRRGFRRQHEDCFSANRRRGLGTSLGPLTPATEPGLLIESARGALCRGCVLLTVQVQATVMLSTLGAHIEPSHPAADQFGAAARASVRQMIPDEFSRCLPSIPESHIRSALGRSGWRRSRG